jgi:hypothetical protein
LREADRAVGQRGGDVVMQAEARFRSADRAGKAQRRGGRLAERDPDADHIVRRQRPANLQVDHPIDRAVRGVAYRIALHRQAIGHEPPVVGVFHGTKRGIAIYLARR